MLHALNVTLWNRRPAAGLVHHPDRGSPYTSVEFGSRLKEAEFSPSVGLIGDTYDNALAEAFVATLKRELLHGPFVAHARGGEDGDLRVRGVLL